ncbi:hypothetical protein [Virgibacillus dakarensis]
MTDENIESVEMNGAKAELLGNDTYSHRMLLDNGENVIEITATDKAGNKTTKNITVFAKFEGPVIEKLTPQEDHYLDTGESVKITMV